MRSKMSDMTLQLDAFVRAVGVDRRAPHAVFLGAGASISSGIPSAGLCIWEWKRNIFLTNNPGVERQFSELTLPSVQARIQQWLDAQGVFPPSGSPEEYGFYIERCFPIGDHRRQFFAERIRTAQPYSGYRLLCLLAEADMITSAWTTNFDGLVPKAAVDFTITPVEVGIDCQHRSLRQTRRGELLCVSLHGDYRYDNLKNTERELQEQESGLRDAFVSELQKSTLIVLGYSGRDASLMEALSKAYTCRGTAGIYWCGFGDEINEPVRALLEIARAAGRPAYFVPTMGFDDTLARLALHCLSGDRQRRAEALLSETGRGLRDRNEPFAVSHAPCVALIKSNAFEIDYPSEIFTFDVKPWPDKEWYWLDEVSRGRQFVAVPHRRKVLALGLLDDIRDAFADQLSGSVERTPVTDSDKIVEHGAVNALMRRAILQVFAKREGVATDGNRRLWATKAYDRREFAEQDCHIHKAVVVYLRQFSGRSHLVLKPTVAILDAQGNELPREIAKSITMEVIGYEHNNKFNQALEQWRKLLLPAKGSFCIEYPPDCGSTFRFKIRTAPLFAQIGLRSRNKPIPVDERIRPVIKQQGIEIPEPNLLFADRSGTRYVRDPHPLRGLQTNRPFDFSLTLQGLAPTIRLGVVSPEQEAPTLNQYLRLSGQVHQPNKTEKDYLIDYPGFQTALGVPIEIPSPTDAAWSICPEPREGSSSAIKNSHEVAELLTRSIDAVVAAEKPHVVLVFIPDRWSVWREYLDDQERFDLHDFVKAYCVQKGIATQFLEQHTFGSTQQCRVWWWLSIALYTKAMRVPWVLDALDPDTAFVGLGFTVDRSAAKGRHVVLGCSHLYNARGEGLQFRLSKIENPIIIQRNPYMQYDDARRVGETIRQLFFESQFRLPPRVVIHKQTPFLDDEKKGLLDGLAGVGAIELIEINTDAALRYVSSVLKNGKFDEDNFPVRRGTVVQLGGREALVWCHGVTDAVIKGWKYFQGKRHIPAPLVIRRHAGNSGLELLASEILGLSKMDWNSGDMYSKLPVTLYSSKQIAQIGSKLQRFGPVSYDYRLFI